MTPAVRRLPASFETWIELSRDEEILELARLVTAALEHRGYALRVEWKKGA